MKLGHFPNPVAGGNQFAQIPPVDINFVYQGTYRLNVAGSLNFLSRLNHLKMKTWILI